MNNWITDLIPEDANPWQWKYNEHPPVKSRAEAGFVMCPKCTRVMYSLQEPYHDADYWGLHCGPQKEKREWDH